MTSQPAARQPTQPIDAATMHRLMLHEARIHAVPGRDLRDLGDAILLVDPIDPDPFWNRLECLRWPDDPDAFDIHRGGPHHLAFGAGGPHYCIGAWAARSSVSGVTLPALFDRLPNLRLDPDGEVTWAGVVFRGPLSMPVLWDA